MVRRIGTLFAVGLALAGACAHAAEGLAVALTNDDGWDAVGIRVLHDVLTEHGHGVTRVGSATQQSGSSAALNTTELSVTRHGPRVFAAAVADGDGAEPLTSGMLAVDIATRLDGRAPDVLVSGINRGANMGSGALHSGTVGAVIGALNRGVNGALGGIAISTDEPDCDAGCVERHYRDVATYLAGLLRRLAADAPLLPPGVGLNVNYPALPRDQIKGVRVARQGAALGIYGAPRVLHYACDLCPALAVGETAVPGGTRPTDDEASDVPDSDLAWFYDGYITIVPITADYTAPDYSAYAQRLGALPPTDGPP